MRIRRTSSSCEGLWEFCNVRAEAENVVGVGDGVTEFKTGDRVAYRTRLLGSYPEVRNYPTVKLLHLLERLDGRQVAGKNRLELLLYCKKCLAYGSGHAFLFGSEALVLDTAPHAGMLYVFSG
mgnify:CR=1 FL=1